MKRKRHPFGYVRVWTYEEIRDGLIRRGFCVSFVMDGEDTIITATREPRKIKGGADCTRAVIRLRNGKIVLPNLGEL